jgi:hypothetical protein
MIRCDECKNYTPSTRYAGFCSITDKLLAVGIYDFCPLAKKRKREA